MKPFFLIPARGGSKGIPGKNIKMLGGEPLIVHSVFHALKTNKMLATAGISSVPFPVIVSTDSREIADVAKKAGAEIPFLRPDELATDTAGSREVMLHAADFMNGKLQEGEEEYDTIILLQPTSPLRSPEDIVKALELYENSGLADMVVSVSAARTNPYYNGFETDSDGFLHISKGDGTYTRRQDAPEVWEFNGAIYVIRLYSLRQDKISRFRRIIPLPIAPETAVDIDSEFDLMLAESILRKANEGK